MDSNYTLNRSDVRRRFDRAAADFDAWDFVHETTRNGLFARIEAMAISARTIVDLGAGTGAAFKPLRRRFGRATIVAVDLSRNMLELCRKRGSIVARPLAVQADANRLPFADHSVDVVFSSLLLPWVEDPAAVAREVSRVLRKDGLFAFATLGPDSLSPLRNAWAAVDAFGHVNRFADMHDVGDAMVQSGLRDPVLDVDRLAITYSDANALFDDLTKTGSRNCRRDRRRSLSGRTAMDNVRAQLDAARVNGKIVIELELVYGHCWGAGQMQRGSDVHIAPQAIPIRRR